MILSLAHTLRMRTPFDRPAESNYNQEKEERIRAHTLGVIANPTWQGGSFVEGLI